MEYGTNLVSFQVAGEGNLSQPCCISQITTSAYEQIKHRIYRASTNQMGQGHEQKTQKGGQYFYLNLTRFIFIFYFLP